LKSKLKLLASYQFGPAFRFYLLDLQYFWQAFLLSALKIVYTECHGGKPRMKQRRRRRLEFSFSFGPSALLAK
jgi:hypothetical protein